MVDQLLQANNSRYFVEGFDFNALISAQNMYPSISEFCDPFLFAGRVQLYYVYPTFRSVVHFLMVFLNKS